MPNEVVDGDLKGRKQGKIRRSNKKLPHTDVTGDEERAEGLKGNK